MRLDDNSAWSAATREHDIVEALFVIDPRLWRSGARRRAEFLAANLAALDTRLQEMGGRLRVLHGDPAVVLPEIATGAEKVYWNDDWTPYAQRRDALVASRIEVAISRHEDQAIHPDLQRRMAERCTSSETLATDHSPFFSAPEDLARILLDAQSSG